MADLTEARHPVIIRGQWLREVLAQASAEVECCRRCQRAAAEQHDAKEGLP